MHIVYNADMAPRKSLPKHAIHRIYFIDEQIASGRYPNRASLAKKYEVDIQTIRRDIKYMCDMMKAPIAFDKKKNGLYYTDKTYRLATTYAGAEDLLAVELVKELMELYRDTPIHGEVYNLLESISVPIKGVQNSKWYKDRIIVPKTITVPVDKEVWQCILTGLKENRVISFNYLKGNNKNIQKKEVKTRNANLTRRTVQPYQLMFDRTAWYLLAYDEDKKDKRIFFVSRISDITVTDKKFSLSKDFDYRSFDGNSYFGVFAGESVYKFEVEIFGDIHWITEYKLAKDQSIKETKTGGIISFTSNQFEKILDWILTQGAGARPLKPKLLVDRWKEEIKDMAKLAKES